MAEIKGGEKAMEAIRDIADKLKGAGTLRVGFLAGATYPNGTPVALVAAIQNYGAPSRGIPPRPFFSNMVANESPSWGPDLAKLLPAVGYDSKIALEQMGQKISGDLRQAIVDTNAPSLSPVTVMLRGMKSNDPSLVVTGKTVGEAAQRVAEGKTNYGASTKPLVDTGYMLSRVDYEVVDK
jgi:hypothetical protein